MKFTFPLFTAALGLTSASVTRELSWATKPEGSVGPISFDKTTPYQVAVNYQETDDSSDPDYVFQPHRILIEARNLNPGGSAFEMTYNETSSHCDFLSTDSGRFSSLDLAYTDIYFQITHQSAHCAANLGLTPNDNDKLLGSIAGQLIVGDFMAGVSIPAQAFFTATALNNPPSAIPTAAPFKTSTPTLTPIAPTAAPVTKRKPKPKPGPGPGPAFDSTTMVSDDLARHLRQAQGTPTEVENSQDNGWISSVCGGYEGCVRALTSISAYFTSNNDLQVDRQLGLKAA